MNTLSKTQRELYEAMLNGETVHYMPYLGRFRPDSYYFRSNGCRRCTAAAVALLSKGYAERYDEDVRGHKLRAKTPTP